MMTSQALAVGTRLEEFEILSVIGVGGFGIVYLALDNLLQRRIAIKEYLPSEFASRQDKTAAVVPRTLRDQELFETGLRSFIDEARLLARLDHPSLLKVIRLWQANGTAYMAMPVLEGLTPQQMHDTTTTESAQTWVRRLARGPGGADVQPSRFWAAAASVVVALGILASGFLLWPRERVPLAQVESRQESQVFSSGEDMQAGVRARDETLAFIQQFTRVAKKEGDRVDAALATANTHLAAGSRALSANDPARARSEFSQARAAARTAAIKYVDALASGYQQLTEQKLDAGGADNLDTAEAALGRARKFTEYGVAWR
jgi:hypothetical protein